jgi:YHS domain-containing protein
LAAAVILTAMAGCRKEEAAKKETVKADTAKEAGAEAKPAVPEAKPAEPEAKPAGLDSALGEAKAKLGEARVDTADLEADVLAKLAAADALDGKTDKIVTRCPSCALKMDGSSEHTLVAHGYTLYFCTDACKERFEADTTKALADLKIPE